MKALPFMLILIVLGSSEAKIRTRTQKILSRARKLRKYMNRDFGPKHFKHNHHSKSPLPIP